MGFHAAPDAVGLQHAAHVNKVLELGRHAIVPAHGLLDEGVADGGLLVGRHHAGFERIVAGLGKGADGLHLWKRLEAILAHKARYLLVERLEAFLAVPCAPVVAVAHAPALGSSPVGLQWRGVHVEASAVVGAHPCGQQLAEQLVVAPLHLLPLPIGVLLSPSPIAHALIDFVVARPQGQRGVVAKPTDVVGGLFPDAPEEGGVGGIGGAGEHEILPDQDSRLVGSLIERVVLVDAATPHAQQVHVGGLGVGDDLAVAVPANARQQGIVGNVVGALGKHWLPVYLYI